MFNKLTAYYSLTLIFVFIFIGPRSVYAQTAPSTILPDISFFKITYPLDANGNDYTGVSYANRNNPLISSHEVTNLTGYVPPSPYSDYFYVDNNEVVFAAHCAGALTSANAYPRCELRETPNGTNDLWLYADEHELNATFRITNLPDVKQEVCVIQLKGNSCNCTSGTEEALRLEYRQDGSSGFHAVINENTTLTDIMDYSLGEIIEARVYVNNGQITIELDNLNVTGSTGEWNYTYNSNYSHGYFKAGCYTQSSQWVEKNGVGNELPTSYGEVKFSELVMGTASGSNCVPMVPTNISVSNVTQTTALLSWDDVPFFDHYNVRYRIVGTSTWIFQTSLQTNSTTISGLTDSQTYEWEMRAKCADGSALPYGDSPGPNFTTLPPAVLAPDAQIHIESGDLYIEDSNYGAILRSPNGSCFRLSVEDDGTLDITPITCP